MRNYNLLTEALGMGIIEKYLLRQLKKQFRKYGIKDEDIHNAVRAGQKAVENLVDELEKAKKRGEI